MKFEEVQVGDFLGEGHGLYFRVLDKHNSYISGLVINYYNIYKDVYTSTDIENFHRITQQDFEKALDMVCNYYTSGKYIKAWEEK